MKTAVSILQEMMVKMAETPEYECISQSGPQHQAMFEYRCMALGAVVTAAARSKKEAKQEAARAMLQKLAASGQHVPPPYGFGVASPCDPQMGGGSGGGGGVSGVGVGVAGAGADPRSYVALLKELCEEYRLGGVEYELVGDTGPPHLRHFTVRARLGHHTRIATATTKKTARQLVAEQLYSYLRENLARVTRDFVEEDALVRAREKAMERYVDPGDEGVKKPDLGQMISEYHLGLTIRLEDEARVLAVEAVEASRDHSPERALAAVAAALGLTVELAELESDAHSAPVQLVELAGSAPPLAFAATTRRAAAAEAMEYVRLALRPAANTTVS